jgi:hypothetical protein
MFEDSLERCQAHCCCGLPATDLEDQSTVFAIVNPELLLNGFDSSNTASAL